MILLPSWFPECFARDIEFWTPLFAAILGKQISQCVVPPPDEKLWYDRDRALKVDALSDLFTENLVPVSLYPFVSQNPSTITM